MDLQRFVAFALVTLSVTACQASPHAQPPSRTTVRPLFGPVISQQTIRGREEDGQAVLLLVDTTIVRVDLAARRVVSTAIAVEPGETCWGLARIADGSLWTLKGRNAVVRVESDGRISRVVPLGSAHAGLMSTGDRLVYQPAVSSPGEAALYAGVPGSNDRRPWSDLKVRGFPGIARAQSSALSLVACGPSAVSERPCWFPDEAAVSLIGPDGTTRRIALEGLAPVAPEVLLTAEHPKRPVRDAYVDAERRIWVLSTGEAPPNAPEVPGGWILARQRDDEPDGRTVLTEPVRLILRVEGRRVIVLAGSGHVSEIAAW